jgi:superfamily I DNA/RNA helicase
MSDTWWVGEGQLNAEQKKIIAMPPGGNHIIVGPPGSGKTNLLLLHANYLTECGLANIAIVVFTRMLRDFIASGAGQYSFQTEKLQTCRQWQGSLLYQYGESVDLPSGFDEQRQYFIDRINTLINERNLENIYDCILLDEAQDYLPEELDIFRRLARSLFAVADARQKIYRGKDCLDKLIGGGLQKHELRYHYRNGESICRVADALAKESDVYEPLMTYCQYDEVSQPSSVDHQRCTDIDDEARRIIERLRLQTRTYPDELLAVVCPTREATNRVWTHIQGADIASISAMQGDELLAPFEPANRVIVCTLHAAKGLEVRAMHIAGCEALSKFPHQRRMAFTAVTRAKTSLSLYYSGNIPGYLENALRVLEPPRPLPPIGAAFGRRR